MIARLYPRPKVLMTSLSGAATSASAFITWDRIAVLVFLAPELYLVFLCALYSALAHLLVVLNLGFRKFSVLPEDYVEAEAEYAKRDKYKCCKKDFHPLFS